MRISAIGTLATTKLANFKNEQSGFTLLEIVVVVFIIGLMVGVVSTRMGGSDSRVVLYEAKRFIHIVNEVQDLSVLTGKPYVLAFDELNNSYGFLQGPPNWQAVNDDKLLKSRKFPERLSFDVSVEDVDISNEEIVNDNSTTLFDDYQDPFAEKNEADLGEEAEDKAIDITPKSGQVLISPMSGVSPFVLTIASEDLQIQIQLNEEQRLESSTL